MSVQIQYNFYPGGLFLIVNNNPTEGSGQIKKTLRRHSVKVTIYHRMYDYKYKTVPSPLPTS